MTQTLISQDAVDLIVAEEVTGEQTYNKRYRHPEKPGGGSGVTVGIGYDVGAGVKNKAQLHADWDGHIPDAMIVALEPCIGVTGDRARQLLHKVRDKVDVPWEAAMAVFDQVDVPRWYNICKQHLPNFEELSLDCRGVLVSLAYNRGPSFDTAGDRYREMRDIKVNMEARHFSLIPADLRSMKRLWTTASVRGVALRREHEARLFEKGLTLMAQNTYNRGP